jgi:hypothetical protein
MSSVTNRAFPVAKVAVERMYETLKLANKAIIQLDGPKQKWLQAFEDQSEPMSLATSIHAEIANFAYKEVQQAQKDLARDIYSKLANKLSGKELLAVMDALEVEVQVNPVINW